MAERKKLLGTDTVSYDGFFDMKKTFRALTNWLKERGYERHEVLNAHNVMEHGTEATWYFIFMKKISDYARIEIHTYVTVNKLQPVDIVIDGKKQGMHKGDININFDCFMITDYENKWEAQPTLFFLRTVFDKFFYKLYLNQFEDEGKNDCRAAEHEIKSYLNLHTFA